MNSYIAEREALFKDDDAYYRQFKKAKISLISPFEAEMGHKQQPFSLIVPYRENPFQNRKQQLDTFVPFMTDYLARLGKASDFGLIVVEQSQDGRKFNRGQLLNVGFQLAKARGYEYHIFHDVDLLPNENLLGYYALYPNAPLHLAAVWEKYQYLDLFFGGVTSFSTTDFERLNGYPNNFWGWGGEDEELYHRIVEHGMTILRPNKGAFTELKHLQTKSIPALENKERFELIAQRQAGGRDNGLSTLHIKRLHAPERLNSYASKYLVELL